MSGEGPNKSGGVQITTVIKFTGHVRKMFLESSKGTGQVRWTGFVLEQVQLV
jgi:hypothetical protein